MTEFAVENTLVTAETAVVAAGRPERQQGAGLNPSISLNSTFVSRGVPAPGDPGYARYDNPAHHSAEEVIGLLEGGEPAVLFASGMAAIAAAMSLTAPVGKIVLPNHAYNGTLTLADELDQLGRITAQRVQIDDTDAVIAALAGASLLWIETPTNPLLELADGPALVAAAHAAGALVVVDNTVATPLRQQPLQWGADVVVHSASKHLGGHSDLVLGAAVAVDPAVDEHLRAYRRTHGATPSAFDAYLLLRGLRTLALRVEKAFASAVILAERLAQHPAVARVRYPGLGAIISIEVEGGAAAADAVAERTRLWVPCTSLGGVESMLERRRRWPGETKDVPENLIRLSVGIENVDDLWRDLAAALSG
ncbi:MAG: PLP-dependent transferase [Propionibacteriaceae bacterium]|jgi:cystathionine gamma-synthase|nr:PLP-dependent transferase [Propionibacteriaceae bacterium]